MKIVIATPLYPPEIGGPATYANILKENLPKWGIEVEVVKFSDVRHLSKLVRHYRYFRQVYTATRAADVVLALDPVSVGLPASLAARVARKPLVVKVVGDYAWEQGQQRFGTTQELDDFVKTSKVPFSVRILRRVQTRVARRASRIIVPSKYLQNIVSAWGIPKQKIEVIYNAVALEDLGTVPPAVAALQRPLIVTAGRLVPWKHIDGVIDAVAEIPELSLVIVGDGPDRVALTERAHRKIPKRCVFTGTLSHPDVLATIKTANMFVLNSSYEGLSHLLIEAAMLRVPIIATDAGGNSEVVEDGANGTLVPVGDGDALKLALRERKVPLRTIDFPFTEEKMLSATIELLKNV